MTDVNLTSDMIAVGVLVALVVELIKAVISRFAIFTETILKPLLPLLGALLCIAGFFALKIPDPIVTGIAVGLMTAGGYDAFKGMAAARQV